MPSGFFIHFTPNVMNVNTVLSEKMRVKPLKQGEKAVFKMLNAFEKEPGREEPTRPESYLKSGLEMIFDPFANDGVGDHVLIGNVIGFQAQREAGGGIKTEHGTPVMIPRTEKVEFIKGFYTCSAEQNNTYAFLMRSKVCKDNPWRPRNVKARFELVSDKKQVLQGMQFADQQYKAEKLVRESAIMDLRALKAKLNSSSDATLHVKTDDSNIEGMMLELIHIAKRNPKSLIWASNDAASKMSVVVGECQNFQVLSFNNEKSPGTWFFLDKNEYRSIHTVSPEKTAVNSLIDFFNSEEGHPMYAQVADTLKNLLRVTK